jgi:predicted lipid-binding transport protein (Tim44 family)
MRFSKTTRTLIVAFSLSAVGAFVASEAFARPGQGRSQGSRGNQTYSAPAATPTAPQSQGLQRSAIPQQQAPAAAARPGAAAAPAAAQPSMARNIMMGVGAGLLGAGLFGMLSGSGFFSGLGSLAGMMGFLLQIVLIGGLIFLVMRLVRGRREAQPAGIPQGYARDMNSTGGGNMPRVPGMGAGMGSMGAGAAAGAMAQPQAPAPIGQDLIGLQPQDFQTFERLLVEIQAAYSADDRAGLDARLTPEMRGYFEEELDGYAKNDQRNMVDDVKLVQGDLSEAWREQGFDYATVAMKFTATDRLVDKVTGKELDRAPFTEVVEIWTFVRPTNNGAWKLSAIQQAA